MFQTLNTIFLSLIITTVTIQSTNKLSQLQLESWWKNYHKCQHTSRQKYIHHSNCYALYNIKVDLSKHIII